MDIRGKTRIFKNEKDGKVYYSTSLSNKLENGTYDNETLLVQFIKGTEPTDGIVTIKDGFITFYRKTDGSAKFKFMVKTYIKEEYTNQIPTITDDDLPF